MSLLKYLGSSLRRLVPVVVVEIEHNQVIVFLKGSGRAPFVMARSFSSLTELVAHPSVLKDALSKGLSSMRLSFFCPARIVVKLGRSFTAGQQLLVKQSIPSYGLLMVELQPHSAAEEEINSARLGHAFN